MCDNPLCSFSCSCFTRKQTQVFTFSADCKPSWGGRGVCSHSKPVLYPCSKTALLIKTIPMWTYAIGAGEERWGKIKNYNALKTLFRKALNSLTQQRSKTALKPCITPVPDRVPGKHGISWRESRYYLWLAAFYPHVLCIFHFCSNILNNPRHIPIYIFLIILIISLYLWVNKITFLYTLGFPCRFAQVVHWHYSRNIVVMDSKFILVSRFLSHSSCGNRP